MPTAAPAMAPFSDGNLVTNPMMAQQARTVTNKNMNISVTSKNVQGREVDGGTPPPWAGGGETAPARPATAPTDPGMAEGATTTDQQARDQDRYQ